MQWYLSKFYQHFIPAVLTPSLCLYIQLERNFMVHSIQLDILQVLFSWAPQHGTQVSFIWFHLSRI